MSTQFHLFSAAVHAQFVEISKGELFVVDIDGDALYNAYQDAFPQGTNEIFRQAREHECSCCKNFIRNIGNVVAIKDGQIVTVWDRFDALPEPYITVAAEMTRLVERAPIKSIFRAEMPSYGAQQTKELASEKNGGRSITWNHFYSGAIASKHYAGDKAATQIGEASAKAQVFRRGMEEITTEAITAVADLMSTKGALYRSDEFKTVFASFIILHQQYRELSKEAKQAFIWSKLNERAATLRNTAFGTLLIDLSAGMDVEAAVRRYETVMAPTNYKRPVALITPRMVEDAMKTVQELGIEDSLHRRFASIEDVSVNDILFVDNAVRAKMKDGSVKGLLMDVAEKQKVTAEPANAIDIGIEDFIKDVVPKAKSMALYVKNAHQSNFVSLTAPAVSDAPHIFKWNNGFGWSYDGNITDSIKERVKAAGGSVSGALRISLAWFNYDDLDLHVIEQATVKSPVRGRGSVSSYEIYFGNRTRKSPLGGMLDVDMNAGVGKSREAVENVVYDRLTEGATYQVVVNNYNKRETIDTGFTIEVEANGQVHHYSSKSSPASGKDKNALLIKVIDGKIDVTVGAGIKHAPFSQEKWGITTEKYVRVDTMMLSPNHWGDSAVGNKHVIFMLEGCKNPLPTRGIYNEILLPALDKHRKVFEVLGNKTMAEPPADGNQLSGLGFSRAGETVSILVDGRRSYNVKF